MLKKYRRLLTFSAAGLSALALSAIPAVRAADHGDHTPIENENRDRDRQLRLTDLYAFIRDGYLVLILNSNPEVHETDAGATEDSFRFPENVKFEINIDRHTQVNFDVQDPYRIGGRIVDPENIAPDIVFTIVTDENGEPKPPKATGLSETTKIDYEYGLKDDPFIRNTRCGANVAAIVLQVPLNDISLPNQPLLIWATSNEISHHSPSGFEQVEHAGPPLRSMFNPPINTRPPSQHLQGLRVQPDVLILNPDNLTSQRRVKFPNGRELEDDVVGIVGHPEEPPNRWTENDKPFRDEFPYLADPHDPQPEKPTDCVTAEPEEETP